MTNTNQNDTSKILGQNVEHYDIKRSQKALNIKINMFIVGFVILDIICLIILLIPFNFLDDNFTFWGVIFILTSVILLLLSILYIKLAWRNTKYAITEKGITIKNGVGFLNEEAFRLESIISVRVRQGYLGHHFGYGDVVIDIPKLPGEPDVILHDIDKPATILRLLREQLRITSKSGGSGAAMLF